MKNAQTRHSHIFFGSLLSFATLSGLLLSAPPASADTSAIDVVNLTIPVSCTITLTGGNTHSATIDAGTFEDEIGESTINTVCNDHEGFAIYAAGYTNDVLGNNVLSSAALGSTHDIATGIYTQGTTTTSVWSIKFTAVSGDYAPIIVGSNSDTLADNNTPDYSDYTEVPELLTKVVYRASETDAGDNAEGSSFTSTYAVFANASQPAGSYHGRVLYVLVHPHIDPSTEDGFYVFYDANAPSSEVEGEMGAPLVAEDITNNPSVTLSAPNFKHTGYGFAGWSLDPDAVVNNNSYTIYGPNETITVTSSMLDDNGNLILHAIWIPVATDSNGNELTFQTTNLKSVTLADGGTLNAKQEDYVTALRDERDNDVYAVAVLADGNLWMIENLRIDGSVSAATMASLSQGVGGDFTKLPASISNGVWSTNTYNETYGPELNLVTQILPQIYTGNTVFADQDEDSRYLYGNYYSWAAATANTAVTNNPSTSICPRGWHLPTLKNNNDGFTGLHHAMGGTGNGDFTPAGSNRWRAYPLNFLYSGSIQKAEVVDRGSSSFYRTATRSGTNSTYAVVRTSALSTVTTTSMGTGAAIRCIAD